MDDIIAYGYSTLCVIGGAIGYAKSGSLPSIIAGSAIGLINAGGTYSYTRRFYIFLIQNF